MGSNYPKRGKDGILMSGSWKTRSAVGLAGLVATLGLSGSVSLASGRPAPVNITYVTWFSARYAVIQQIVNTFNKTHPTIHVTLEHEPANNSMLTKLLTELAAGTAPNIAGMWGPWAEQLADTPGVLPLNHFLNAYHYSLKQFYPDTVATVDVNGKVIGLPADNDNLMVYYNKKLFNRYHVPYPNPNWTWADMVATAKKLNHPRQKNYGFLMFLGTTEGVVWRWETLLWQAGGHMINKSHTKVLFDSPAGIRAMKFYLALEPYSDVSPRSEYENPFLAGRVAMSVTGSWNPQSFSSAGLDYGVVPLPAPYPGGPHTSVAGPDMNVILRSTPAKEKASWIFLMYLEDQHSAALQASLGHLPFRPDVLNTRLYQETLKKYPVLKLFAQNARNARIRPRFPQYSEVSLDLGNAIEAVLLHKMSPKQALQSAAAEADQQLSQPAP
jgi:multiple sugar transport system substrate-binding protein